MGIKCNIGNLPTHLMKKRYYLLLPIYCSFFVGLGVYEVIHPSFSSSSVRIGNYEIQISTTPSIPEVGKDTKIHLRFMDQDGKDIDKFRMSLKIYHNDDLLRSFPPAEYTAGSSDIDYVFEKSGNHVLRVDLLDLKSGTMTSYAFNVTVLALYGTIFSDLIIAGITGAVGIIIAIIIFQKKLKSKNKL